jgi:hypothetical protein
VVPCGASRRLAIVGAKGGEDAPVRVERRMRALVGLKPLLAGLAHDVPDHAEHRRQELVSGRQADQLVEARVFIGVRLARGDFSLLCGEDLSELGELCLSDALGRECRDRGLDEASEFDDVGEGVPTRDEASERTGKIVGRGLPNEGPAAGSRLDDPEELERAQGFANGRSRHLELLGELSLGRKLVPGPKVTLLQETLDLLDDSLIEAAATNRLDDGQVRTSNCSGQVA